MKKNRIITILLVALSIFSTVIFTGCNCKHNKDKDKDIIEEKTYYYVTFDENNGFSSSMIKVEEGSKVTKPAQDPVKEGYTFQYWALSGEENEFNFNNGITGHITLVAKYLKNEIKTTRVIWNEDESMNYVFEGNSVPRTVEVGTNVIFKVNISPFYEGQLIVKVNNKEIEKDENDYYSFIVEDVNSITVDVDGLQRQDSKLKGVGSSENPYLISNASQFKTFIDGVNSYTDKRYNKAHFLLTSDIDFKGYEINTIGTVLNSNEFSGYFDGNNHTISNFKLVENDGIFGLFGYLVTAELSNLNIKADLECIPSNETNNLVGSLVAYNIGSDIINCSFNGSITVKNNLPKSSLVYLGGLVGYMQSYSNTYSAGLAYCTVNASVISEGENEVYSKGGIVGLVFGSSDETPACIYNSVFNGKLMGLSLRSGGIVGTLRKRTSITQCYSSGEVIATSNSRKTAAGGIVGVSENETSVTYSISTALVTSSNPDEETYIMGDIIGAISLDGANGMDDKKTLELENYYSNDGKIEKNKVSYDLNSLDDIIKLVNWSRVNWNDDLTPKVSGIDEYEIKISFDFGRDVTNEDINGNLLTQKIDTVDASGYIPIYWIYNGSGKNTFMADDGTISYGYFLDEERTIRIPSSYILNQDCTIYVGFAEYKNVVGEYYVNLSNEEIKLTFEANGKLVMNYNGVIANYMYTYDNKKITIIEGYFAHIEYPSLANSRNLDVDYYADITEDGLVIYNDEYFPIEDGLEIKAYRHNNAMGKWYTSDNKVYTFLSDGTGNIDNLSTFKYECLENKVVITIGDKVINAIISNDGMEMTSTSGEILSISKYDEFKGTWESEFVNPDEISFDGKGNVVYQNKNYNYVINEQGVLEFSNYTAYFNESGLLVLENENESKLFGKLGSYIGMWTDTAIDYWVIFEGINKDGYGYGHDSNNFRFTYIVEEVEESTSLLITMYYSTKMYGYGQIAVGEDGTEMLYLAVYTPSSGIIIDDYNVCYIDPLFGTWNGSDGKTFEFNGLGAYDIYEYINTLEKYWDVRGFVTITENGIETTVRYYYDRNTLQATFNYNGIDYVVKVGKEGLIINEKLYKEPDGLEKYEYQIQNMVFVFNGKSNVNLGIVEILINGVSKSYSYTFDGSIVEIFDGLEKVYIIDTVDGYKITDVKNEQTDLLGLYHRLIGNTYAVSATTVLSFNNQFSINGATTAQLITKDQTINLEVLYIDSLYIGLYINGSLQYYVYYLDNNCAALCDYAFNVISVVAKEDDLRGIWTSNDEKKIVFDGLSNASEYVSSTCEVTETDELGEYVERYTYEKQENYYVIYTVENDIEIEKYYVYTEYTENAMVYTQGDKTIYIVAVTE